MVELFIKNNQLVPQKDWEATIEELKQTKYSSNQDRLKDAILNAVRLRLPKKRFGIFFSGGVDSTTIAYICKNYSSTIVNKKTKDTKIDFICYTVGYNNAEDVIVAQKAAKQLGFTLKVIKLELDDIETILKKVIKLLNLKFDYEDSYQNITNIVAAGVATVVYAAVQEAKKDKIDVFFGGLGSEEIFAGYQRHADAANIGVANADASDINGNRLTKDNINEECWRGLKNMWARDLLRDCMLAKKLKFTALTPYLDKDVILNAMGIDAKEKISNEQKKIILRKISESLGIPKEFSWRKKKAAQYGSAVDKAIEKLAKKNGFKYKLEYLKYISY